MSSWRSSFCFRIMWKKCINFLNQKPGRNNKSLVCVKTKKKLCVNVKTWITALRKIALNFLHIYKTSVRNTQAAETSEQISVFFSFVLKVIKEWIYSELYEYSPQCVWYWEQFSAAVEMTDFFHLVFVRNKQQKYNRAPLNRAKKDWKTYEYMKLIQ